ncbi:MAG: hypothetical protein MK098_03655 [Marinovum sp.]|nr:hypothetical protein [Marinovum sp.]
MKIFATLPILLMATAAVAEIPVRSGEHKSFTRLVLTFPEPVEWSISQTAKNASLEVANSNMTFDTRSVFDRVPRTRLLEFSENKPGILSFELACKCTVRAFNFESSSIVIDISDTPFSPPEEVPSGEEKATKKGLASLEDERAAATRGNLQAVNPTASPHTVTATLQLPTFGFEGTSSSTLQEMGPTNRILADARGTLLAQVSRATVQGLLNPPSTSFGLEPPAVDPSYQAEYRGEEDEQLVNAPTNINLRAKSSFDDAIRDVFQYTNIGTSQKRCSPQRYYDFNAWGISEPFQQTLGVLRRQLFGELDRVNESVAKHLAQTYLFFGFGAEAISHVELIREEDEELSIIKAIGEIFEFGKTVSINPFANQYECKNAAAMWSVLSIEDLDPFIDLDTDAIQRAFVELPKHVREYVGPKLSSRLRLAGRQSAAQGIMRTVDRGALVPNPQAEFEMSELQEDSGQVEKAEKSLEAVVNYNSPESPEALVKLIDRRIQDGVEIEESLASLAASYAFELQGTDLGLQLKRAYVLALSDSRQFPEAIDALRALSSEFNSEERRITNSIVVSRIAKKAGDSVFLTELYSVLSEQGFSIDHRTENAVAQRLIGLGLLKLAAQMLSDSSTGEAGRTRRILRAELAIANDEPREALSQMIGLSGDDVDRMRARAFEASGELARAQELYHQLGESDSSVDMAFLAGDWTTVAQSERSALAQTAVSNLAEDTIDFEEPSLSASEMALERSVATEIVISNLLREFEFESALDAADQ